MAYVTVPFTYDEDSGRLIRIEGQVAQSYSPIMAEADAKAMLSKLPECMLVRVYRGTVIFQEYRR